MSNELAGEAIVNQWNIPDWLEREVLHRDQRCVYCGVEFVSMGGTKHHRPSWEHLINDVRIVTRENIVRCCVSCNSSKGARDLAAWLESDYCRRRRITAESVAPVVKAALALQAGTGEASA